MKLPRWAAILFIVIFSQPAKRDAPGQGGSTAFGTKPGRPGRTTTRRNLAAMEGSSLGYVASSAKRGIMAIAITYRLVESNDALVRAGLGMNWLGDRWWGCECGSKQSGHPEYPRYRCWFKNIDEQGG